MAEYWGGSPKQGGVTPILPPPHPNTDLETPQDPEAAVGADKNPPTPRTVTELLTDLNKVRAQIVKLWTVLTKGEYDRRGEPMGPWFKRTYKPYSLEEEAQREEVRDLEDQEQSLMQELKAALAAARNTPETPPAQPEIQVIGGQS